MDKWLHPFETVGCNYLSMTYLEGQLCSKLKGSNWPLRGEILWCLYENICAKTNALLPTCFLSQALILWYFLLTWNRLFFQLQAVLFRDYSGYGLSQWEMTLHHDMVSNWLSPYPEISISLFISQKCPCYFIYMYIYIFLSYHGMGTRSRYQCHW